jgi:serine/threonine protein kinase
VGWDSTIDVYTPMFKNFTNKGFLIQVELVLENPLHLILVLEHSNSLSLAEYISDYDKVEQDNFLLPEEIVSIARDLLLLLQEIHAKGKVLFSIKPENIYFSSESTKINLKTN